jgi:hypothetical protein
MNNEPAALLESDRHSSFHLWGKSREYEHGRSHEGRNGDGRERFDHLIPDFKGRLHRRVNRSGPGSVTSTCALNNGALLGPLR